MDPSGDHIIDVSAISVTKIEPKMPPAEQQEVKAVKEEKKASPEKKALDVLASLKSKTQSTEERVAWDFLGKLQSKIPTNVGSSSSAAQVSSPDGRLPSQIYTLKEHCRFLKLKPETASKHTHWNVDMTNYLALDCKIPNVVVEYCQPVKNLVEMVCGIPDSSHFPVRTLSIRIRPDCKPEPVFEAVEEAWKELHPKHQCQLDGKGGFSAIGADGEVPVWLTAFLATHKKTRERRLWIRTYHASQVYLDEEQLQLVGGVSNQKAPLRDVHTPGNQKLKEAAILVQYVLKEELFPSAACPKPTQGEMTQFLHSQVTPSYSVTDDLPPRAKVDKPPAIVPSLSEKDYPVMQESWPWIERIWSELESRKCTYNTLEFETSRFGMRPCQPTLDKNYCWHLCQISQLYMLMELQSEIQIAEHTLHQCLTELAEFQTHFQQIMRGTYRLTLQYIPMDKGMWGVPPVALPRRKEEEFPWHPDVRQALDNVSQCVAANCLAHFDPLVSKGLCEESVLSVYKAFETSHIVDQSAFLKQRNRQAMIKLAQLQSQVKDMLQKIREATNPEIVAASLEWKKLTDSYGLGVLGRILPWVEFTIPRGGKGCITCDKFVLVEIGFFGGITVYAWPLKKIRLVATPKAYTKLTIYMDQEKMAGINPNLDAERLTEMVERVQILQSLL